MSRTAHATRHGAFSSPDQMADHRWPVLNGIPEAGRTGGVAESASVWPTRALRWRFPGSYCSCNLRDALCVWETVAALRAWCASVRAVRAPSLTNGTTCRRRRVIQDSGRGGWIARRTRATDGPIDLAFLAGHILRRCLDGHHVAAPATSLVFTAAPALGVRVGVSHHRSVSWKPRRPQRCHAASVHTTSGYYFCVRSDEQMVGPYVDRVDCGE